ncbi:MAG: hypothetical protein L0332_33525 [Chloroflexi bacterium]|nr:hypothetical protein [Chloroflexota bacterium]
MLKKSYSRKGRSCRVTFTLPATVNAEQAHLCGEFNDWDLNARPMKSSRMAALAPPSAYLPAVPVAFVTCWWPSANETAG